MWVRIPGFAMAALTSFALMAADAPSTAAGPGAEGKTAAPLRTVADFEAAAARNKAVLAVPKFEHTPTELEASTKAVIAEANRNLDALAAQAPVKATFASTVAALDDVMYAANNTAYRVGLMKEVEPEAALRDAATAQTQVLQEWSVGVIYREDVFKAVKAFADAYEAGRRPRLEGEDLKLYRDTMRDYRRAGLTLDKATRDTVEALQKKLARLSTDFDRTIGEAKATVIFTKEELEGVPDAFLASVKTADERYAVLANVTPHYLAVALNAKHEATRKRLEMARSTLAQEGERAAPRRDRLRPGSDRTAARLLLLGRLPDRAAHGQDGGPCHRVSRGPEEGPRSQVQGRARPVPGHEGPRHR